MYSTRRNFLHAFRARSIVPATVPSHCSGQRSFAIGETSIEKTIFAGFPPNSVGQATRRVAVLAFDGVVLGDLAIPLEIFGRVRNQSGRAYYDVQVCGATQEVHSKHLRLKIPCGAAFIARADTVIVPGIDDLERTIPLAILRALKKAFNRGALLSWRVRACSRTCA